MQTTCFEISIMQSNISSQYLKSNKYSKQTPNVFIYRSKSLNQPTDKRQLLLLLVIQKAFEHTAANRIIV